MRLTYWSWRVDVPLPPLELEGTRGHGPIVKLEGRRGLHSRLEPSTSREPDLL